MDTTKMPFDRPQPAFALHRRSGALACSAAMAAVLAAGSLSAAERRATRPAAYAQPVDRGHAPARPTGPCDIYAAAGAPCVAAHSTTRALSAAYDGPLYQVMRQSDGKMLDIGVVRASAAPKPDAGGYADAAAQDAFCADTYCWITKVYDQSGKHNDLIQPPRGYFSGPSMGGANNLPIADMAPITVMGHKAYSVFIAPGMGLRLNDAKGTAVDDQAEGQYWVINGHHYNSGCCFDYGNGETDSRDDGDGTMETAFFGNTPWWYHGSAPGPWIMTDQENNLVGCVNADKSNLCTGLPSISWRFVTAIAKGEPHHWTSMGGDAQRGRLATMFDGPRIDATYDPMRKQGAIVLGNGGDNSNGSQGTFYEGAMTAAGTFPSDATDQLVQANVVAARYDVARVTLAPAAAATLSPGLQSFVPGVSRDTSISFTNTGATPATGVTLAISVPRGWSAYVAGTRQTSKNVTGPVAPGASVRAIFTIIPGASAFNGDLVGHAAWTAKGEHFAETAALKVRNAAPIKINEFRVSDGSSNPTNTFIELYNAGTRPIDISRWSLTQHPTEQAIFSSVTIPAGTKLAAGGFYVFGLSGSGLAVAAQAGDATIHIRDTMGMKVGDTIIIDSGAAVETRKIASLGSAAGNATTLWQPLPDGPVISVPAGATNVPVTSVAGFVAGEKIALGYGATYPTAGRGIERYEVATVTQVGKPGTQAYLSKDAPKGAARIMVTSVENISAGDQIRLDIDSVGHGIETVTVKSVDTAAKLLELTGPLTFDHAANMPFSARGTGISFTPASRFAHASNEPVRPLGTGIMLDRPLTSHHAIDAVVQGAAVGTAGFQGKPNQWFGGPALSPHAGNIVLRDANGLVVDSLNYGLLVDPWASEGYQAVSGFEKAGCFVAAPGVPLDRSPMARMTTNSSAGRFPDGRDSDSNCTDFLTPAATILADGAPAGATNIKVDAVADFQPGQKVMIGSGSELETLVVATVGTPGATALGQPVEKSATTLQVASRQGFNVGQSIVIDTNSDSEAAVVASTGWARSGATITIAAPLKFAHAAGTRVAGTGISFAAPLARAHASGSPVTSDFPTPGAPNRYSRPRPQM